MFNILGCVANGFTCLYVRLFEKKARFLVAQLRLNFGCDGWICIVPKNGVNRIEEGILY